MLKKIKNFEIFYEKFEFFYEKIWSFLKNLKFIEKFEISKIFEKILTSHTPITSLTTLTTLTTLSSLTSITIQTISTTSVPSCFTNLGRCITSYFYYWHYGGQTVSDIAMGPTASKLQASNSNFIFLLSWLIF